MLGGNTMSVLIEAQHLHTIIDSDILLQDASISINAGEVVGLIGINGSGKTALVKHLTGILQPDSGLIKIDGKPVNLTSPTEAIRHGIFALQQNVNLIPTLSIAENIYLNNLPKNHFGQISYKELYKKADELLASLGLNINSKDQVSTLSYSQKRSVELVKAVARNSRILILDEPCLNYTGINFDVFFNLIEILKKRNVGILFISHNLNHILKVCDKITYISYGCTSQIKNGKNLSYPDLMKLFSSKDTSHLYPKLPLSLGRTILKFENYTSTSGLQDATLSVRTHEIMGIWGTSRADHTLISETLYNNNKGISGSILVDGKPLDISSPVTIFQSGISYLSENIIDSLFNNLSIIQNITISNLKNIRYTSGHINSTQESTIFNDFIHAFNIQMQHPDTSVMHLSGGNQQKVRIARSMFSSSKIYILEEPTAGLDVCSKIDIYNIISNMASYGTAFILISTDINELIGMCDKIAIISSGRIQEIVPKTQFNHSNLTRYQPN